MASHGGMGFEEALEMFQPTSIGRREEETPEASTAAPQFDERQLEDFIAQRVQAELAFRRSQEADQTQVIPVQVWRPTTGRDQAANPTDELYCGQALDDTARYEHADVGHSTGVDGLGGMFGDAEPEAEVTVATPESSHHKTRTRRVLRRVGACAAVLLLPPYGIIGAVSMQKDNISFVEAMHPGNIASEIGEVKQFTSGALARFGVISDGVNAVENVTGGE